MPLLRSCSLVGAVALVIALPAKAAGDNERLAEILVASYPDFLEGHSGNDIIWKDGSKSPFDDGKPNKSFDQLLNAPSLKDMFLTIYPSAMPEAQPPKDFDPGRVRNQAFFLKMYGDCRKGEVTKSLVDIVWLPKKWGRKLQVTRINGVDKALQAVSDELDRLPKSFDRFLVPPAGTFNCRSIAGTGRMSAHGTATAIDIATAHAGYWRWAASGASPTAAWRNEVPAEIVRIFESHGFIWGGKWHHFDMMHFEYRPEIIAAGRLHANGKADLSSTPRP